jgi:hypothetical protein
VYGQRKRNLRGPVHSVINEAAEFTRVEDTLVEQPYLLDTETFDEQGRLLEINFHNTEHPEYASKQVFSYDTNGKLIEQSFACLNGTSGGKTLYLYDSEGSLLEVSSYDALEQIIGKRIFTYHSNGKKAEELFFDYQEHKPDSTYSYDIDAHPEYDHGFSHNGAQLIRTSYDLQGNPKELQFLSENEKLLSKVIFTTDAAGRIVKDAQYSYEKFSIAIPEGTDVPPEIAKFFAGNTALFYSELVYDDQGRKIEDRMYLRSSLIKKRVFVYGDDGELIAETTYDGNGALQSRVRIEHECDSHHNWTRKLVLSWNKETGDFEPVVIEHRTIKYYE